MTNDNQSSSEGVLRGVAATHRPAHSFISPPQRNEGVQISLGGEAGGKFFGEAVHSLPLCSDTRRVFLSNFEREAGWREATELKADFDDSTQVCIVLALRTTTTYRSYSSSTSSSSARPRPSSLRSSLAGVNIISKDTL